MLGDPFVDELVNSIKPAATQNYQGYYFGDTWNATSRLTLNLGVRWGLQGPWTERHNRLSVFQPDMPNPLASGYSGALAYVDSSARSPERKHGPQIYPLRSSSRRSVSGDP